MYHSNWSSFHYVLASFFENIQQPSWSQHVRFYENHHLSLSELTFKILSELCSHQYPLNIGQYVNQKEHWKCCCHKILMKLSLNYSVVTIIFFPSLDMLPMLCLHPSNNELVMSPFLVLLSPCLTKFNMVSPWTSLRLAFLKHEHCLIPVCVGIISQCDFFTIVTNTSNIVMSNESLNFCIVQSNIHTFILKVFTFCLDKFLSKLAVIIVIHFVMSPVSVMKPIQWQLVNHMDDMCTWNTNSVLEAIVVPKEVYLFAVQLDFLHPVVPMQSMHIMAASNPPIHLTIKTLTVPNECPFLHSLKFVPASYFWLATNWLWGNICYWWGHYKKVHLFKIS